MAKDSTDQAPGLGLDDASGPARMGAALAAGLPTYYVNGFVNGLSPSDVITVLERNGQPVAILNMSYTLAKSLAQGLGGVVADLESKAGRPMLTTKEIEEFNAPTRVKNT